MQSALQSALALVLLVTCGMLLLNMTHVRAGSEAQVDRDSKLQLIRHQATEINRLKRQVEQLQQQQQQHDETHLKAVPTAQLQTAQSTTPLATVTTAATASTLSFGEKENFLLATRAAPDAPLPSPDEARRIVRALLSIASLLKRTLILPPGAVASSLDAAELERLGVRTQPATVVSSATQLAALPESLRCSHVRIESPAGLDSEQFAHALRHYASTRILEFDRPHEIYCGASPRAPASLVTVERTFDQLVAPGGASLLPRCSRSLREEEVSQYWDMGKCKGHRVRVQLPPEILAMPKGSDLLVTFSTGSVATMAHNWVLALRKAGVREGVVIGALDDKMLEACAASQLPCVRVKGDASTTNDLKKCQSGNIRKCPSQYPKMSILKVGFYRELLEQGFNVFACDADAIFMGDPRPLMRAEPWARADMAVATDCIDVPADGRYPLLHCDFNTGLIYMRGNAAVLNFTEAWREKVANAKEERIRDQAAFNMITKATPGLQQHVGVDGKQVPRVYRAGRGEGGTPLLLGVLPLARFLNGHTFFVQHAHTLPNAEPPISVHMTYQFAEGSSFAYGKRQRLREAGLWFVDGDEYWGGYKYLAVSAAGATLPPITIATNADSRDAVKQHLAEHAHLLSVLRAMLGIAKALGRVLVLPRMLCYCDYMWKEMRSCRVGGAESMRLPFDCPMDHVLDTPLFFDNGLGVDVREPNFLHDARVPPNVSGGVARAQLPPRALTDAEIRRELQPHEGAPVLELDIAAGRFCGFADAAAHARYLAETERMLTYERVPFCTMEGSNDAPLYSRCCTPWHEGEKFFPCQTVLEPSWPSRALRSPDQEPS